MGQGGAFLMVLQLFMAVTAAGSAEQIAVSSLFSYDIYREYINPQATGQRMVLTGRIGVALYSVLSGVFAVILLKLELSLGWGESRTWAATRKGAMAYGGRHLFRPRLTQSLRALHCSRSVPVHGHHHRQRRVPHCRRYYVEEVQQDVSGR